MFEWNETTLHQNETMFAPLLPSNIRLIKWASQWVKFAICDKWTKEYVVMDMKSSAMLWWMKKIGSDCLTLCSSLLLIQQTSSCNSGSVCKSSEAGEDVGDHPVCTKNTQLLICISLSSAPKISIIDNCWEGKVWNKFWAMDDKKGSCLFTCLRLLRRRNNMPTHYLRCGNSLVSIYSKLFDQLNLPHIHFWMHFARSILSFPRKQSF